MSTMPSKSKKAKKSKSKFQTFNDGVIQTSNHLQETEQEWQLMGKDDIKHLQQIHFGGGDCSEDESVQSERSSIYEQYRPSPFTDDQLTGRVVFISENGTSVPSTSKAAPNNNLENWQCSPLLNGFEEWISSIKERNIMAGHSQPSVQSVEMMITSGMCESCNIPINSVAGALSHISSLCHMAKIQFCVLCSKNIEDALEYEHINQEEHILNANKNCLICGVMVSMGNMMQHKNGSKHRNKIEKFAEILKCYADKINEPMKNDETKPGSPTEIIIKSGYCESCPNWSIESVQHAATHLVGEYHLINSKFCIVCNEKMSNVALAKLHRTLDQHKQNIKQNCLICNVKVSENIMLEHLKGSKHRKKNIELSKILQNREVVKTVLDIKAVTWFPDLTTYPMELKELILKDACMLCNVKLYTQIDIENHYQGKRHTNKVTNWLGSYKELINCGVKPPPPASVSTSTGTKLDLSLSNFPELKTKNANLQTSKLQMSQLNITNDTRPSNGVHVSSTVPLAVPNVSQTLRNEPTYIPPAIRARTAPLVVPEFQQILRTEPSYQDNLIKVSTQVHLPQGTYIPPAIRARTAPLVVPEFPQILRTEPPHQENGPYIPPARRASTATSTKLDLSLSNFPELKTKNDNLQTSKLQMSQPNIINDPRLSNSINVSSTAPQVVPEYPQILRTEPPHQDNLPKISTQVHLPQGSYIPPAISRTFPVESQSNSENNITIEPSQNPSNIHTTLEDDFEKSKLEDKVLSEIKKLADSLYFSKKVPLDKALEFLKRFNKEIEDCKHKVQVSQIDKNVQNCFLPSFAHNETDVKQTQDKIEFELNSKLEEQLLAKPKKQRKRKKLKLALIDENLSQNNLKEPEKNEIVENSVQIFAKSECDVDKSEKTVLKTENLRSTQKDKHLQVSTNQSSLKETEKNCSLSSFAENGSDIFIKQLEIKSDANPELKEQVFSETKKLVDHLYFSKKMPLDKALEYLKRFNKELEDRKRDANGNVQRELEKICFMPAFANNIPAQHLNLDETLRNKDISSKNVTTQRSNIEDYKGSDLIKADEDAASKESWATGNDSMTLTDSLETETQNHSSTSKVLEEAEMRDINMESEKYSTTFEDLEHVEIDENNMESQKYSANCEVLEDVEIMDINTGADTGKSKTTNDDNLVENFMNKKVSIVQLADENNFLEIEVLTELTKLVDLVYKSTEIPLAQTLYCLESFNKEVERFMDF